MSESDHGAAPPPLRLVEDLINTRSIEFDTDELGTADAVAAWLRARDLLRRAEQVTPAEHRRVLRMREGLRALIAANHGEVDPPALADLAALADALPVVLDVTTQPPRLVPARPGAVDHALATMLIAVARAVDNGTWSRLKVCREPACRWAYYDHSRNRSRAWCSMATCGNRAKARTFRRSSAS